MSERATGGSRDDDRDADPDATADGSSDGPTRAAGSAPEGNEARNGEERNGDGDEARNEGGDEARNEGGDEARNEGGDEARKETRDDVPADVRTYERFTKMDGAEYDRVNDFLRDRTYITAREWAIARLCADFRTETGVEMTKVGENLPDLVPFMTDTYTPQAVNQARASFEDKVRTAGATFLYGAMSGFFTAEELDEMMYEVTEVAKFLLEVEGVDLAVEEELDAEERVSEAMREVREASAELRAEDVEGADGAEAD